MVVRVSLGKAVRGCIVEVGGARRADMREEETESREEADVERR
jgi:hypothetical protein